jgi:ATP-dependent protease ClpP protease subunit
MIMEELSRKITIYGNITSEKIEEVVRQIVEVNAYDDYQMQNLKQYQPEPIYIYICSGGGELLPSLGLCRLIEHSLTPIVTVAMGEAGSAAFLILISGHYRLAMRGTSIMTHQMSGGAVGSTKDCKITVSHMEKIEEDMISFIREYTELPEEIIEDMYLQQTDKYLSIEEALNYKVIDFIYGESTGDEEQTAEVTVEVEEKTKKKSKKSKK